MKTSALILIMILCSEILLYAQETQYLTEKTRTEVIDSLIKAIDSNYFFTEKSKKR